MILAINYAVGAFLTTQKFNSKRALKFGADKVKEYTLEDLSDEFRIKNEAILKNKRGGGYWIWKPYIILDALSMVDEGDYVVYTDAGSAFVNKIDYLIQCMERENTDIMCFQIPRKEKMYTKRDAFILMDCDTPEFYETPQICATYILCKKSLISYNFMKEYLYYVQDERIVTDKPNEMGKMNYEGFVENRHDQSVFSLLCKKNGIPPFRDPSKWEGEVKDKYSVEVNERSRYPQVIESHRNPQLHRTFQLRYRKWYKYLDIDTYKKYIMSCKR